MTGRSPKLNAESFNCPRCSAHAHQDWEFLLVEIDHNRPERFMDQPLPVMPSQTTIRKHEWAASKCFSCKKSSVWRGSELVFPIAIATDITPHELMSHDAKEIFEEACAVLPVSRRAAAALARASMELELRHLLSDTRSDLHSMIGELSTEVSTDLWQSLTVLRDTGNKSLHGGDNGVVGILIDGSDEDLVEFLLSAVNRIVDEKVAKPQRASQLYNLLPQGVRDAAEQKKASSAGKAHPNEEVTKTF